MKEEVLPEFPLARERSYLNTASIGLTPRRVIEEMILEIDSERSKKAPG